MSVTTECRSDLIDNRAIEYIFNSNKKGFEDAKIECETLSGGVGVIASIPNREVQKFINERLSQNLDVISLEIEELWFGLHIPDITVFRIDDIIDPANDYTNVDGLPQENGFGNLTGVDPWNENRPNSQVNPNVVEGCIA